MAVNGSGCPWLGNANGTFNLGVAWSTLVALARWSATAVPTFSGSKSWVSSTDCKCSPGLSLSIWSVLVAGSVLWSGAILGWLLTNSFVPAGIFSRASPVSVNTCFSCKACKTWSTSAWSTGFLKISSTGVSKGINCPFRQRFWPAPQVIPVSLIVVIDMLITPVLSVVITIAQLV